jgi:hypothetical protein
MLSPGCNLTGRTDLVMAVNMLYLEYCGMSQLKLDCQKCHEPSDQANLHDTYLPFQAPAMALSHVSAKHHL